MPIVVNFIDFTPPRRFDNTAWTNVQIEEATSEDGPWTIIDNQSLSPIDTDPTDPMVRDFSTVHASDTGTHWRVTFVDGASNQSLPSLPITQTSNRDITPSLDAVAAALHARISTQGGGTKTTFDSTTKPTAAQVEEIIDLVSNDLAARPRVNIPQAQQERGRHLATLMSAALVELRLYPEKSSDNGSTYAEMIDLFNAEIEDWVEACRWPLLPNVF